MDTFTLGYGIDVVQLDAVVTRLGDGLVVVVGGGASHVGTVVLAQPRPSLRDPSRRSATASVLNRTGHLDEGPLRAGAEMLAARTGQPVVVAGGIHREDAQPGDLEEIVGACGVLFEKIAGELEKKGVPLQESPPLVYNGNGPGTAR